MHRTWSFYIVVVQGTTKKCTKNYNARAQPLFSSLNLLFGSILVAIAVVRFVYKSWQTRTHCCGHIVADTNASPFARARNICCGHKKCFWFCSETFCVRNKCFPVCAAQETSWATMCPRLPGPLSLVFTSDTSTNASNRDDPSANEIRRKHQHKQNHLNLPNCLGAR